MNKKGKAKSCHGVIGRLAILGGRLLLQVITSYTSVTSVTYSYLIALELTSPTDVFWGWAAKLQQLHTFKKIIAPAICVSELLQRTSRSPKETKRTDSGTCHLF
jgi:hypothetical protein